MITVKRKNSNETRKNDNYDCAEVKIPFTGAFLIENTFSWFCSELNGSNMLECYCCPISVPTTEQHLGEESTWAKFHIDVSKT